MISFDWPIIGHQAIKRYLQTVILNNRLNHAYLFYGPPSLGKSLLADYFISSIYCTNLSKRPCGSCLHCCQNKNNIHPDIIRVLREDGKQNITIEQIRQARSKIQHATFLNSHRLIFIPEAHTLSLSAVSGLLKIIEEPTAKTIFLLISPTLQALPATLLSRLQLIKFSPLPFKTIKDFLIEQGFARATAYELAHLSNGYPGHIMPFINHPKLLDDYKQKFRHIFENIFGDLNLRFFWIEKISAQINAQTTRLALQEFLSDLESLLRDMLLIKNMSIGRITHLYLRHNLSKVAERYTSSELIFFLSGVRKTSRLVEQNVNPRLALENLVLHF